MAMPIPEAPLTASEQDERYLHLVPDIEAEFQRGYDDTLLEYHVWGHGLGVHERTAGFRDELRTLGVGEVPGEFMTQIDTKGHDFRYKKFFDLTRSGDNPYSCPEELSIVEGGEILRAFGVDELTIAEWGDNVWGTKLGVRCGTLGRFTLCAGDMANTGEDFETVMRTDTQKLKTEKERLEKIEVDDIRFAVGSLIVLTGYHFKNLWVPSLLAQSPSIQQLHQRQRTNLLELAREVTDSVGIVGEEQVNSYLKKLDECVGRLCPINIRGN